MARFNELAKSRMTVIEKLLDSQKLCKSLFYGEENFLDMPDIDDPSILLNTSVYPYNFIPHLTSIKGSYVTFSFRNYKLVKRQFKSGLLHFQIVVHVDKIKTEYGILRSDFILQCIDEIFNERSDLGIGDLIFYKMDEMYVNEEYVGYYIQYKMWDFN